MKSLKHWTIAALAACMIGATAVGTAGCEGMAFGGETSSQSESTETVWTAAAVYTKAQSLERKIIRDSLCFCLITTCKHCCYHTDC